MFPYLIAGAIGFVVAKLLEEDEAPKYADGGLIAPNGKPSNLTPEQYKLVRTPEFKAWFGDWQNDPKNASKVVDENGEPLMVIHKTNSENDFYIFDKNKIGDTNSFTILNGFFFGNYKKQSDNLRNILCFLNIKNPIFLNQSNTYFDSVGYQEAVQHFIQNGTTDYLVDYLEYEEYDDEELNEILDNWEYADGVIVKNLYYDNFDTELVVFQPNQIKLADGTNTKFDGENPDIRYAGGGKVKSEYIKRVKEAIEYVENSAKARMIIDFEDEEGSKQAFNEGKDYERIFPIKSKPNSFVVKRIRDGVQEKYDAYGIWNEKTKFYDYQYPKNTKYGDKSKEFDTLQIATYDDKGKIVGTIKIATTENKQEDVKKGAFKIAVRQNYQNKGIASKLIEKAESEGIDFLEALKNNKFTSKGRGYFISWLNKKLN